MIPSGTGSADAVAAWARQENEKIAMQKLVEGVQDAKTNQLIDSNTSKQTTAGKVRYPS